ADGFEPTPAEVADAKPLPVALDVDFNHDGQFAGQRETNVYQQSLLPGRQFTATLPLGLRGNFAVRARASDSPDHEIDSNAVTLPPNTRTNISGAVNTGTDLDYFRFDLTARSGVFFDIDSREIGLSTTLDTSLTLYAADGTTVLDSNDNGYDFDTGFPAPAQE